MRSKSILVAVVFLFSMVTTQKVMATMYFQDFESGAGSEWSLTNTDNTYPATFTRYLGRYDTDLAMLTLPVDAGVTYTLEFDLYIIDSWDGNGYDGGPDYFNIDIDGTQVFHEIFCNFWEPQTDYQTFRAPDIGWEKMGYNDGHVDAIYRNIQIPFTATDVQVQIGFQGEGLQSFPDETWGLDNVSVTPEPATLLLLGFGAVLLRRKH